MSKRKARTVREQLIDCVPTNWCDSLLTGQDAALPAERAGKWNCRDIEALLSGIQDRMRSASLRAGRRKP